MHLFSRLLGRRQAAAAPARREPRIVATAPRRRGFEMAEAKDHLGDFIAGSADPNGEIRHAHRTLVGRSRELANNSGYAKRYLGLLRDNVVGPQGVALDMRPLTAAGELDELLSQAVADRWREWGKRGSPTVCGTYSWRGVQKAYVRGLARDGEFLALHVVERVAGRIVYRLQVIEPDLLDRDYNAELTGGRRVIMGVELDQRGQPLAYHILASHPSDAGVRRPGQRMRIPASRVLHRFDADRIGRVRGIPALHAAATKLHMHSRYETYELIAARVGAAKMGVIYTDTGEAFGADPDTGEVDAVGDIQAEADGTEVDDRDRMPTTMEPGVFDVMPEGHKVELLDPTHPTDAFGDFTKGILRGAASGLGVSYVDLASDLEGVNYSSIRSGALTDQARYAGDQTDLIEDLLDPVFANWLAVELAQGRIAGATSEDFGRLVAAANWRPRGWAWIDPLKEVRAAREEVDLGTQSRQGIAAARGRDWRQVRRELKDEEGGARVFLAPGSAGEIGGDNDGD